jgi:putative ABC transport system substrate-binding protein
MRRFGVVILAAILALAPLAAETQQARSTPRIARVFANTPEAEITGPNPTSPYIRAFLQAMRELGWADGQNIAIERRSAGGRPEHWDALVQDLIKSKVDLIVITAPVDVVQKAEKAGNGLAIVLVGADPDVLIQRGLVKSIAKPGKNVTGLTNVTSLELREKRLQLLKEAAPKARRVAYLGATAPLDPPIAAAARVLSLTVLPVDVPAPEGLEKAFAAIKRDRIDAVNVGEAWFFWGYRRRIIELGAKQHLPAMYANRIFTESGGLMSYGIDYRDLERRAAAYADKILKGAKPGDLPIEQPTKFELVINLKTAKALGLTIPQSLLLQANEVIE